MQLSGVDSNLLVMLHPLLQTKSVNLAASVLGLSPSATSHALARLRVLLDDELLVRAGRGMVLTTRAKELLPMVAQAVASLEQVLLPAADFQPRALERTFHILQPEYLDWVLLPKLDVVLRKEAPKVNVHTHNDFASDFSPALRNGHLDIAFGLMPELPPDMHTRFLFRDSFVSMVRTGHPCLEKEMTLERFAALEHILVAPSGKAGGVVDDVLAKHGLQRRVARIFASFFPAPYLVSQSDYVLTLPKRVADVAAEFLALTLFDAPETPSDYDVSAVWHSRLHHDPAHQWLREQVCSLF